MDRMNSSTQSRLLFDSRCQPLVSIDGDVSLHHDWLPPLTAQHFLTALLETLAWQQSVIRIYGREQAIPRLNAWYGDPGCRYSYSGVAFEPLPWTAELEEICTQLHQTLGVRFNSVLANLYRNGRDSVAWHSDNEPELGINPVIASVSLGAERRFTLKHKFRRDLNPIAIDLPSGSLLLMSGATQHNWLHQISKTTKAVGERVNLTFRYIYQSVANDF
jgi:alkylated DNA repair dioxygenase AlkB